MSVKTVENMIQWVEENIKENPSLEAMSQSVGYSPFYCSSKFHEYVGVTFKEYVSKRKLNMAAVELKITKKSILTIAVDFGFSSQEAFSRAFVNYYGCTPRQYRKTYTSKYS